MSKNRNDLDRDDAGNEFYTPRTTDYIQANADRLGISFERAAELYEKNPDLDRYDDDQFGQPVVSEETAARMNAIVRDPSLPGREFSRQFNSIFGGE